MLLVVFFDFSKISTVDHDILPDKLDHYKSEGALFPGLRVTKVKEHNIQHTMEINLTTND